MSRGSSVPGERGRRGESEGVVLPLRGWRAQGPQGPPPHPYPAPRSALRDSKPADQGPPGAEAPQGGGARVREERTPRVVGVEVVEEEVGEEEEEEKEEEGSQPLVCYQMWPLRQIGRAHV